MTAAMIGTGFSLVSAADVSDIEIQSEEVVEVSEEPVIEFAEEIPEEEVTETEPVPEETEVQPKEVRRFRQILRKQFMMREQVKYPEKM